ncbi:MAG: alpha/beta hydrolase [Bacteroidota bacterium]
MKIAQSLIKFGFSSLSLIAPGPAGKLATKLFQYTGSKRLRSHETPLLSEARTYHIAQGDNQIPVYEMGPENGKLVVLVHGWASWAGSMLGIGRVLSKLGYRVISFDLPGHGQSPENFSNLFKISRRITAVLEEINPQEPFSMISHSLGSAGVAHALRNTSYQVNQLIYLTSPDSFVPIFSQFAQTIGLNKPAYRAYLARVSQILNEDAASMRVSDFTSHITYEQLILIHSQDDTVIPFRTTKGFLAELPDTRLFALSGVGHYRMLWSEEVLNILSGLFSKEPIEA